MKKVIIVVLSVFILAGIGLGTAGFLVYRSWSNPLVTFEAREFEVRRGDSVPVIARRLNEEGFISRTWDFELLVRFERAAGRLRAGRYLIEPGTSLRDLVTQIAEGRSLPEDLTVRVVEGLTVPMAAQAFEDAGLFSAQSFIDAAIMGPEFRDIPLLRDLPDGESLIGYLFPDTYRFLPGTTPEQAIRRMVETAARRFATIGIDGPDVQLGRMRNLHDVLTFASIVQKETPVGDEDLIAGVFFNRLQNGWRFESDATINFLLGTSMLIPSGRDIRVVHPYNTYLNAGLPPGPINSPGLVAINATLNPARHDFFFFLHTPNRETRMSRTFQEHLAFRARYWE
jgi:UPF0755 protein